ncbi:uncharacterized protein LOC133817531 isoform X2 [Humulus lupulus]|uniref:uncharacterized protein LOC133817531 isoform X2 n=1 Tax=Humulus lupulus TaxID=3486 RepID=UPI002B4178FA|nr:uncharacterized protein LOC133817531 isoform X2 [Humulus lupulus]
MAMTQSAAEACSPVVLKTGLTVIALCIAGYILGPPLYWHFMEGLAAVSQSSSSSTCPPCVCDCSSQPLLSIPIGLSNTSFTVHTHAISSPSSFVDHLCSFSPSLLHQIFEIMMIEPT